MTKVAAKFPGCETRVEGGCFVYLASATEKSTGKRVAYKRFPYATANGKTFAEKCDSAYKSATDFLADYEPHCSACGRHFCDGLGARCDCGKCLGTA